MGVEASRASVSTVTGRWQLSGQRENNARVSTYEVQRDWTGREPVSAQLVSQLQCALGGVRHLKAEGEQTFVYSGGTFYTLLLHLL